MINKQKKKQTAFEIFRALAVSMVLVGHFTDAAQDLPVIAKKIGLLLATMGYPYSLLSVDFC